MIEIKCPFSVKDGEPHLLQDKKGSFMDKMGLIKSHKYYTQVQGQLEVCERNYCDFIVWTPNGLYIERIYKDVKFIERLFQKLTTIFVEQFLPEIMTRKLQMCKVYCVCQQEEYGKNMIQCENKTCKYEWFHYSCIGLRRAPKGSGIVMTARSKTNNIVLLVLLPSCFQNEFHIFFM